MNDLRQQLAGILRGRAAVVGVGNPEYGDDGAGVWLAEALRAAGCRAAFVAGTTPERLGPQLAREGFEHLLFVDAVEFGGRPGEVILLNSREIQNRFPQVSTHKISLGTVARMIEQESGAAVWLLGIQPKSLHPGGASEVVQKTVRLLAEMLAGVLGPAVGNLGAEGIPQGLNVNSPGWNPAGPRGERSRNPAGVELRDLSVTNLMP